MSEQTTDDRGQSFPLEVTYIAAVVDFCVRMRRGGCLQTCAARFDVGGDMETGNFRCPIGTVAGETVEITVKRIPQKGTALPETKSTDNSRFKAQLESYRDDAMALAVKALENQHQEQWISVEDELPDDDIEVLVYDAENDATYFASHDSEVDGWSFRDETDSVWSAITHWMHLTAPTNRKS